MTHHINITRSAASLNRVIEKERETWKLTDLQFALAAMGSGIITPTEAEDWVASGTLPAVALGALEYFPDDVTRAAARIRFRGAREIPRVDPFVELLKHELQMTDEQVDQLFRMGMQL